MMLKDQYESWIGKMHGLQFREKLEKLGADYTTRNYQMHTALRPFQLDVVEFV